MFVKDRSWETSLCWPKRTNKGEMNGTRCTLDPQVDLSHVLQNSPSMLCPTCSVRLLSGDAWMQRECKVMASKVASFDSECWNGKIIFFKYLLKSVATWLKYGLLLRLVSQFRSERIDPYSRACISCWIVFIKNVTVHVLILYRRLI